MTRTTQARKKATKEEIKIIKNKIREPQVFKVNK